MALLAAIVVILVVAQLVLPGIASDRVREEVGRYGSVRTVNVHAAPAIALLWGDAQEITVTAGALRMSPEQLVRLEQKLSGVDRARLGAATLELVLSSVLAGEVPLDAVLLAKDGNSLRASATVSPSAVSATLPAGLHVEGISAGPAGPELAVSGEAFGVRIAGRAIVRANEGRLIVEPAGLPFGGFAAVTIFSDPRIYVESVSASRHGEGVRVELRARPR